MIVITCGIQALPAADRAAIVERVFAYDDFSEANDRRGEHDFGALEHKGVMIFWKIDCYDRHMRGGSPDAADPAVTRRVLTISLAEEY
jgi:uncharacterized protein DUF3768